MNTQLEITVKKPQIITKYYKSYFQITNLTFVETFIWFENNNRNLRFFYY